MGLSVGFRVIYPVFGCGDTHEFKQLHCGDSVMFLHLIAGPRLPFWINEAVSALLNGYMLVLGGIIQSSIAGGHT